MAEAKNTETLRATIQDVVYQSPDGRFAVYRVAEPGREGSHTVTGQAPRLVPGESFIFHGRWTEHRSYGKRFELQSYVPVIPQSKEGIVKYLGSGLIEGIGPALAERIVAKFGDKALDVICQQSARLREVSGVGEKKAKSIAEAVRNRRMEAEALIFLQGLGLGTALSRRIQHELGANTASYVRENPFALLGRIAGVGFKWADQVAATLGISKDDPRRAQGAILYRVGQAQDEGDVLVPRSKLQEDMNALEVPLTVFESALVVLTEQNRIVVEEERVYLRELYEAEREVAKRLRALGVRHATKPSLTFEHATLSDAQKRAIEVSFEHGLVIITGGPGTGKTTTVRSLVQCHQAQNQRVVLAAPTGRAARRLSSATGQPAQTLHRLLEYNPMLGAFMKNEQNTLDADIVLVDEASMLDLLLAQALLQAVPPQAKLILVGDANQLPPISAGHVFAETLQSGIAATVELKDVFRQASQSDIVRAAHAILHGEMPALTPPGTRSLGDIFWVRATEPQTIQNRLLETVRRIETRYGIDVQRELQILAPMRKGPLGVEQLNKLLQHELNSLASSTTTRFVVGDKVMQLRNNYTLEVFNGDIGNVVKIEPNQMTVRMEEQTITYKENEQRELDLAYACTIHKAQGSEFDAVIVILHPSHYVLLARSLLYTAVTRARKLVVLLGDERALRMALSRTTLRTPHSHLQSRLQEPS